MTNPFFANLAPAQGFEPQSPQSKCGVLPLDEAGVCPFCGVSPYKQEPIHGHYATMCCHQVVTGCCDGTAE